MDEQKTNENLAAAMGMSVEDVLESDHSPARDSLEAMSDGADEGILDEGTLEGEEQDEEETTTSSDAGGEETLSGDQRQAVMAALAGDGLPKELIESLSPDQLQAYWAKRQQRDEAFNGMKEDLRKFKSGPNPEDDDADDEGAPTNEPDKPRQSVDLASLIDEFGEDEAEKIAGYVESSAQAIAERAVAPLLEAVGQMIDTAQRSRLSGMVPDGLGDGWYEAVRERAVELGQAGMYADKSGTARQDALFDAALRLEYPDLPTSDQKQRSDTRSKQRRNGTPARAGRQSRQAAQLSKEDAMNARALAAVEGKSLDEIRRLYG